ncbi:MAG: hypothetical protein ACXV3A_12975, partial [Kineosporiaceae bacterium]
MCDDQGDLGGGAGSADGGLSRRRLIQGAGLLAAGALVPRLPAGFGADALEPLALLSPTRDVTFDGTSAFSMAMHVHSSFSEQSGSMDAQMFQAASNSVDVLWWTDHDHRMASRGYRKTVHFTSLTNEAGASGEGGPWHWEKRTSGPLASASTGGIVSSPSSPKDPVSGGAMRVTAKSTSTAAAAYGYFANCHPGGDSYKDNLTGQSLTFEVMLGTGWSRGYLEFLAATSLHPAKSGRPSGIYSLSYRFVPSGAPASRVANGISGVVTIPVAVGAWTSVTIRPDDDITVLWPDMDVRDFQL